ncbi:MAG: hypothetical protein C4295_00585 [Candidatus Fervidibacterota bacterium]
MRRPFALAVLLLLVCVSTVAQRKYDFVVNPANSQMNVNLSLQAFTSGTLIGNYDPNTNPNGTRTKPGVHLFGFTGNYSVPVQVNPSVEGNVVFAPAGTFSMVLHPEANQVILMDFFSDLLPSGTAAVPARAEFSFDTFTTRNPSAIYPGGTYNTSLGDVVVRALTITQTGDPAVGTLTPLGGNRYAFAVAPVVTLYVRAELQGSVLATTSNPNPLALVGEVGIAGDTATILSANTIDWSDVDTPNQPIPRFAMDLPTPTGDTAHFLFDLTLNEVRTRVNGTYTIAASGSLSLRRVSGTITLGDYTAPVGGLNVAIEVRPAGETTPTETHLVALNDAGEYQFETGLWGTFDLSAKGSHWLRQTVGNVVLDKNVQVDFALTNGDIDGDNEVTLFDFGQLVSAFGSMPGDSHWNPNADLDGDGEVTLFDFGVLVRDFGAIGDE